MPATPPSSEQPATHPLDWRWLGRVSYAAGLEIQEDLVQQRREGRIPDTILLLEHDPVYTIGRTRDRSSLRDADQLPHPVIEINRGGKATYHGPGQLVGYLILDLNPLGRDLHHYLRTLEDGLIAGVRALGVEHADRREGLTGVWVEDRKLISIGVGVRHWIAMHGFALNVDANLEGFSSIVPCGIDAVEMTSLERELGQSQALAEVGQALRPHLTSALWPASADGERPTGPIPDQTN